MKRLLLICIWSSGCAAGGTLFHEEPQPTAPRTLVYIYQPGHAAVKNANATYFVSETKVATLEPAGYTAFYLPAGQYFFREEWSGSEVRPVGFKANLLPSTTHYFRLSATSVPGGMGRGQLLWIFTEVSVKTALAELKGHCTFQEPFDVLYVRPDAPYVEE